MTRLSGTLTWDTSVPEHHGWLLHSAQLCEGVACIPHPAWYHSEADADEETLSNLVRATLHWEGWPDAQNITLTQTTDGYRWTTEF